MRADEFREYLRRWYRSKMTGSPLSEAAAKDALSRCRRVEAVLELDLDKFLKKQADPQTAIKDAIVEATGDFEIAGDPLRGRASLVRAAKLYCKFLESGR